MRVRFVIRKSFSNKSGECPMNCRITINGKKATDFSIKRTVDPEKWESRSQRLKGKSDYVNEFNSLLDDIRSQLVNIYTIGKGRGVNLSADEVKDIYLGKKDILCSYIRMTQLFIEEIRAKDRTSTTIRKYSRCFKLLNQYLGGDLNVMDIERRHVSGFWKWLKRRGYKNDYCNKVVQACIGLFRYGVREGLASINPFAGYSLEWKKELDITCLTEEEMLSIQNTKWSAKLQRVADSFIFMCHTGLHISDYRDIREEQRYFSEGFEFMKVKRIKTGVESIFPISDVARGIIEKYGSIDNLPKISGQKSNDYLKLIGGRIATDKILTNKIARKTFTDMYLNKYGFSAETVATMLGHTTTRQIKHYGAVREKRIALEWRKKVEMA